MNIDEHPCPAFFWESEFHEHNDTDIAIIGTLAIPYIYRFWNLNFFFGICGHKKTPYE